MSPESRQHKRHKSSSYALNFRQALSSTDDRFQNLNISDESVSDDSVSDESEDSMRTPNDSEDRSSAAINN